MRFANLKTDLAAIRNITPDKHMRDAIGYLQRSQWSAKSKFQCWIEDDTWWLAFVLNKSSIRIMGVGVAQNKRSLGLGGKIVSHLAEYGKRIGKEKITLRTRQVGREFLFYERLGFVAVSLNGDDVEMELNITNAE